MDPAPKRQRGAECLGEQPASLRHSDWLRAASKLPSPEDHLGLLYPHRRDADCYMDELNHIYYVHGERYRCSVSGVWKVFFPDFDKTMPCKLITKAERGPLNLESSVYWLYMHLSMLEELSKDDAAFWDRADAAFTAAQEYCALLSIFWSSADARDTLRTLLGNAPVCKPQGSSCYFLPFCAGYGSSDVQEVWARNGNLESLKGTLLHKQAELFMQELASWQREQGRSHAPLSELLPAVLPRARAAASASCAMLRIVAQVDAATWDHASTQAYFQDCLQATHSVEYMKFEAWLHAHPSLSPFRSEWSIYDEDAKVAGQVDSLWFDEREEPPLVIMADWKRAREILSADQGLQKSQAFNNKGRRQCAFAPEHPGPCRELYDCAFSHYLVQQHLYADFLRRKYDITVTRLLLVQCHPQVGATSADFHEAELPSDATLAGKVLAAFQAGWQKLL